MTRRLLTRTSAPSLTSAREGRGLRAALIAALACVACLAPLAAHAADPFIDEVVSFTAGARAGFGADELPGIVLGPPRGAGDMQGSLDVLALGDGGQIVVAFNDGVVCDQPGVDFTIFENSFLGGGTTPFTEVGIVAVSADGVSFIEFPYDAESFAGLAGKTPVFSNPENGIDPTDPTVSGGDSFDLADLGLSFIRFIRIADPGAAIDDLGNHVPPGDSAGFDLDAIAAVHFCDAPPPSHTPTSTPTPTATPTGPQPTSTSTRRPTPSSTPDSRTPTVSLTPTPLRGDANGDGRVDEEDGALMVGEMFDGDGDSAAAASGGLVHSWPGVDRNDDGVVTVSDLIPR